jgi:hypothetical protein
VISKPRFPSNRLPNVRNGIGCSKPKFAPQCEMTREAGRLGLSP